MACFISALLEVNFNPTKLYLIRLYYIYVELWDIRFACHWRIKAGVRYLRHRLEWYVHIQALPALGTVGGENAVLSEVKRKENLFSMLNKGKKCEE